MNALKNLPLNDLISVVEQYPWFGAARKELSVRTEEFRDAALYVGDRKILSTLAVQASGKHCGDSIKEVLETSASVGKHTEVRIIGGDYFSREDYEKVDRIGDGISVFPKIETPPSVESVSQSREEDNFTDFCTETLARIYAEQGHFEQAKSIYSKLILRYPEKNAYFAALIEKLSVEN